MLSFLHTAYYDATTIEAYTRDDAQALAWYRAQNLTESEHYLHV